jgi:hypothetical protein
MRPKPALFLLLAAALLLTSCAATSIGRINADPTRYRNRTVHVNGTVVTSFGALGTGGYQVQDNTGKIYVLSSTGVPASGSRVTVTGTVINGVTVMGRSFGTTIREQHHKIHF